MNLTLVQSANWLLTMCQRFASNFKSYFNCVRGCNEYMYCFLGSFHMHSLRKHCCALVSKVCSTELMTKSCTIHFSGSSSLRFVPWDFVPFICVIDFSLEFWFKKLVLPKSWKLLIQKRIKKEFKRSDRFVSILLAKCTFMEMCWASDAFCLVISYTNMKHILLKYGISLLFYLFTITGATTITQSLTFPLHFIWDFPVPQYSCESVLFFLELTCFFFLREQRELACFRLQLSCSCWTNGKYQSTWL